jgi:sulfatase maturation enzyme AslB (radical SAM superfamily)
MPAAPALRVLSVVLTPACNLRCAYCYQDRRGREPMAWGTLRAALDLLLDSRQRKAEVEFYGGEPLLAFPVLRRGVAYAKARRPARLRLRFGVTTNGLLLDERRADFLARHRIRLSLSFDGLPAAQDRRAPGSFTRLDRTLDRLHARHPGFFRESVEVGLTVTAANLTTLADSVDYFLDKEIRTVHLNPRFTPDPDWRTDDIDELDRQLSRVYRSSRRLYARTGRVPVVLFRKNGPPSRARGDKGRVCGAGTGRSLVIDVDGQATGCVLFASSYRSTPGTRLLPAMDTLRIGRLHDPAFAARLAEYPDRARKSGLLVRPPGAFSSYDVCRECRWRWRCDMCPAAIGSGADGHGRIPDLLCAFTRVALKYCDRFPRQPLSVDLQFLKRPVPKALQKILPSRGRSVFGKLGRVSGVGQRQPT